MYGPLNFAWYGVFGWIFSSRGSPIVRNGLSLTPSSTDDDAATTSRPAARSASARVDARVGEVVARVRLVDRAQQLPALAEPVEARGLVPHAVDEGVEEAEAALEHGRGTGDALAGHRAGEHAAVGRPAAVDALDRAAGAVGLDDAGAHGRGDAHRVGDAVGVERRRAARRRRRSRRCRRCEVACQPFSKKVELRSSLS